MTTGGFRRYLISATTAPFGGQLETGHLYGGSTSRDLALAATGPSTSLLMRLFDSDSSRTRAQAKTTLRPSVA